MQNRFWNFFGAGVIFATLVGCSASSFQALDPAPPFAVTPIGAEAGKFGEFVPNSVRWWQYAAADLSNRYQSRYVSVVRIRPWFDLPLIGLAASAVGALFYGAHPDTVFGIGLGAGVIGATRTYLNFGPAAGAYLAGSSAAECVAREAAPIVARVEGDGTVPPRLLETEIMAVQRAIAEVETAGLLNKPLPSGEGADVLQRYSETQTLLRNAVQAAREAIRVAQDELNALYGASSAMGAAVTTIENKVAERVAFQSADFAALQASIMEALSSAASNRSALDQIRSTLRGEPEIAVTGQRGAEGEVQQMKQLLDNLSVATFTLTSATPQIAAAKAAVLQCAAAL